MKFVTLFCAAFCLTTNLLSAQETAAVPEAYNAETMLKLCRGDVADMPAASQSMTCTFRIQGVADMMSYNCLSRDAGFESMPELSASVTGSRGAVRQIYINYMEARPEIWGEYWAWSVALALSDKFPCEL